MGRQSTALYLLSSIGEIPRADHAIFSDTSHESQATYNFIENHLKPWAAANNGIPVHTVRQTYTIMDALKNPSQGQKIPAFVMDDNGQVGMLKRTCTDVFKIRPIMHKIREIMGLKSKGKFPEFEQWMGINIHEWQRMREPQIKACTFVYPFIGRMATHNDHKPLGWKADYPDDKLPALYARFGLPVPPHSSCVFCPFQSESRWKMVREVPSDWEMALEADSALEAVDQGSLRGRPFLVKSAMRLRDIPVTIEAENLFSGCDSGYCGV